MNKLISPATCHYLLSPHIDLHTETIDYISDLDFSGTELMFLTRLLDKYYLRLNSREKRNNLVDFDKKVKSFQGTIYKKLYKEIVLHENHLSSLDEDRFSQDENNIRNEHERVVNSVKNFTGAVKNLKAEIFDFIEIQLKQDKELSKDIINSK